MGNAPSNRRVTVVNDDVVGVVQVSENVIRRLKGKPEKVYDTNKPNVEPQVTPKVQHPIQSPLHFAPEPYSSTIEQRQKYHEEYSKAERSWNNRIHELEAQNRFLVETAKRDFAASLTDVEENHVKNSYAPVCPDKQQKVSKCYKENVKFPLNCSREVHEFMECLDKVRMSALLK